MNKITNKIAQNKNDYYFNSIVQGDLSENVFTMFW